MCKIDIANQINNPWDKDSVLALTGQNIKFGIKIIKEDKQQLHKSFISGDKSHDRKVIAMIHAFLIFKCLDLNKDKITSVDICPDCRQGDLIGTESKKGVNRLPFFILKVKILVKVKF